MLRINAYAICIKTTTRVHDMEITPKYGQLGNIQSRVMNKSNGY